MAKTYTEIDEFMYNGDESHSVDELDADDRAPWRVIKYLNSLGGFDHWWDDIEAETQDKIFDGLRTVLR